MKIGILIPSTNKDLVCVSYEQTHFYNIFLRSFVKTYDKEHEYKIYLVVDEDDKIYKRVEERKKIESFISLLGNVSIKFINSDISKGWVTKMWNKAFKDAYDDGCDYFYQCGDDIEFLDNGWVNSCISILKQNDDSGVTGPIDWGRELFAKQNSNCKFILTQTFVSRKHMDFFGFYFPEEIRNWFCDDWITNVYKSRGKLYLCKSRIFNKGGSPRYVPDGMGEDMPRMIKLCNKLVNKHNQKIV